MRQKLVLGVAGLVVWGAGLAGCQNTPQRTPMASSSRPMSQTASGQTTQGWNTSTATAQGTGRTNTTTPTPGAGGAAFNGDPNAFPRTSQDAIPRQVGNQTSSYTTMPNNVSDSISPNRAAGSTQGTQSSTSPGSTPQRPGFTQTGFTTPAGQTGSTTIPGKEDFATPAASSGSGSMGSVPASSSSSGMPTAPPTTTPRSMGSPTSSPVSRVPADEFPPQPDLRGPQAGPQIPLPPQ